MHEETRPRGRPRGPHTDQKILEAALSLMARHGYARMSVDAVAAAAGVTKPTIYRRYPSKEALATAALAASRLQTAPAESGDTRTDLIAHLRHFQRGVGRPFGMAMLGTVLAEEHETPELLALYREHVVRPRRHMVRTVLARARARDEFRDEVDIETAINMLIGSYYAHYLADTPVPADWPERTTDAALAGLLRPPTAA